MATSIDLEDERMVSYVPLLVLSEEVLFSPKGNTEISSEGAGKSNSRRVVCSRHNANLALAHANCMRDMIPKRRQAAAPRPSIKPPPMTCKAPNAPHICSPYRRRETSTHALGIRHRISSNGGSLTWKAESVQ